MVLVGCVLTHQCVYHPHITVHYRHLVQWVPSGQYSFHSLDCLSACSLDFYDVIFNAFINTQNIEACNYNAY